MNQRFLREPLIKSHNALRESVGCCCKAPCAGNGHSLAKHGNEAATPYRPRPKGRSDPGRTLDYLETRANLLFDMLGTPTQDKRQVLLDQGHSRPPRNIPNREVVDWSDKTEN